MDPNPNPTLTLAPSPSPVLTLTPTQTLTLTRLNGSPEATLQLFDLFKPPTHQRPPPSGENAAGLSLLDGQLGGGQYLLGSGQLLGLTRQLRSKIFTLWKALLLGRRVLFYAPPPVGRLCERALSAHQLTVGWAACCAPHAAPRTELLLYVGLNDEQELLQRSPHAGTARLPSPRCACACPCTHVWRTGAQLADKLP